MRLYPFAIALNLMLPFAASAHAILLDSNQLEKAVLSTSDFPIELSFNSRIDASRSKLILESAGNTSTPLSIDPEPKQPAKIMSKVAGLKPGAYKLHWQVLAVDGHITSGVISFRVR